MQLMNSRTIIWDRIPRDICFGFVFLFLYVIFTAKDIQTGIVAVVMMILYMDIGFRLDATMNWGDRHGNGID